MSLLRSSIWFSLGTSISRIFGLLREMVLAYVFGASTAMDAFLVANRIPNLFRELLAEGALGSSFTKVFAQLAQKKNKAQAVLLQNLYFWGIFSLIFSLLGIFFAPEFVAILTHFASTRQDALEFNSQAILLTRLLFPFIGFMIVGSIAQGVLYTSGKYLLSSLAPMALNIGYILGALVLAPFFVYVSAKFFPNFSYGAISGLAIGVLLGGFLQTAIQLAGMRHFFLKTEVKFKIWPLAKESIEVLTLMLPMVIASSAGQINVIVNTNFASSLTTGAVTWLSLSFRLLQLPIGIFAVAISTVALPQLSKAYTNASKNEGNAILFSALELALWLVAPCFAFIAFNSLAIVKLLYEHGNFTATDSIHTASTLYYYAYGIFAYALGKVFNAFYYAIGKTKFAMAVSIFSIGTNFILNYFLVESFGHNGLALTASLVLTLNTLFLFFGAIYYKARIKISTALYSILCLSIALICAFSAQWIFNQLFSEALVKNKIYLSFYLLGNGLAVVSAFFPIAFIRTGKNPYLFIKTKMKAKRG